MRPSSKFLVAAFAAAIATAPTLGHAATNSTHTPYFLEKDCDLQVGCFGPCACPVLFQLPVTGSFVLVPDGSDPLYDHYRVESVDWKYPTQDSVVHVRGSGTYLRGGEVAVQQRMQLDLSVGGGPVRHFDSGMQSPSRPFPALDISISLHQAYCFDSVFTLHAAPTAIAGGGGANPRFGARLLDGNPSRGSVAFEVTLPEATWIRIHVLDIQGREAREIRDATEVAGSRTLIWDGLGSDGRPAPAGVYLLLIEAGKRRVVLRTVHLP